MEALAANYSDVELAAMAIAGSHSVADSRIRAGVLLAPAIGGLLEPRSLKQVDAPIVIRWGDADDIALPEFNARVYLNLIPEAQGDSVGMNVGHYVFRGQHDDPSHVRTRVADETVAFFSAAV
jgi:predicted dienelactone hydrolase